MEICDRCKQPSKLQDKILGLHKYESNRYGATYVPDQSGTGRRIQLCSDCAPIVGALAGQFIDAALGAPGTVNYTIHPKPRFPWFTLLAFIANTASFLFYLWLCWKN